MLNIVGNIAAFIPFGFFIPVLKLSYRGFINVLLDGVLFTACIETVQLILKVGSFDVDDLLLNTIGGILGYLIFALVNRIRRHKYEKA